MIRTDHQAAVAGWLLLVAGAALAVVMAMLHQSDPAAPTPRTTAGCEVTRA